MRKLLACLLFISVFISCKKDNDTNTAPKTKQELFTDKTWVYEEILNNYNNTNTTVIYKRGKTTNIQNYDASTVKFNADGSFNEVQQDGTHINGTWELVNNESQMKTTTTQGSYTTNIIKITADEYIWYDPNSNGGVYARNIHI